MTEDNTEKLYALAKLRRLEVADRVDHSGHVGEDGEPCTETRTWKSRMGRDIAMILDEAGVADAAQPAATRTTLEYLASLGGRVGLDAQVALLMGKTGPITIQELPQGGVWPLGKLTPTPTGER